MLLILSWENDASLMIIFLVNDNKKYILSIVWVICILILALSRSRDRPVLVRGPWREANRALWEEAQPRRGSGQRRGKIYRQDAAAAQQPQKRAETGERVGSRGQRLVPVTACPPPPDHGRGFVPLRCCSILSPMTHMMYLYIKKNLYWLINQDVVIVNICSDLIHVWTHFLSNIRFSKRVKLNIANFIHQYIVAHTVDSLFFNFFCLLNVIQTETNNCTLKWAACVCGCAHTGSVIGFEQEQKIRLFFQLFGILFVSGAQFGVIN